MPESIRILVADGSAQTRQTLRMILSLEKDMSVPGEASDGREAVRRVQELRPDVVLLDVSTPGSAGAWAREWIAGGEPRCCVTAMSAARSQEHLREALSAGARDYLVKPFASDEVVTAIRRVCGREC